MDKNSFLECLKYPSQERLNKIIEEKGKESKPVKIMIRVKK